MCTARRAGTGTVKQEWQRCSSWEKLASDPELDSIACSTDLPLLWKLESRHVTLSDQSTTVGGGGYRNVDPV